MKNFAWGYNSYYLIPNNVLQNMKRLKKVTVIDDLFKNNIVTFLSLLPHHLESLEIKCFSNAIEEIEKFFYEKFPTASLIVTD